MRTYLVNLVIAAVATQFAPVVEAQSDDEAAIRKVVEQAVAAANQHDAKAATDLFTKEYENWRGSRKGRAAWEKFYAEFWKINQDSRHKLLDEIGIIFVTPDVAIYKGRDETLGGTDADGNPRLPLRELRAWVLVKREGRWLLAAGFTRPTEE